MTDNSHIFTPARLGSELDQGDERDLRDSPSYWWVPFVDDEVILRGLLLLKENYEPEQMDDHLETTTAPQRVEETDLFRRMFRTGAGLSINRALRDSDLDRQSAMLGLDDDGTAKGTADLLDLVDSIEEGYIAYLFGNMGTGKTDFAVEISRLWSMLNPEGEIASNVTTFEQADQTIERYPVLEQWVQADDRDKLMVWDEASSNASGYAVDATDVIRYFRNLLQSFRKNRANLLIIGHTGKDVHPHIRRQANDLIEKESKKVARIYEEVDDNGEGVGERAVIRGIEATRWDYDTKEMSNWYWET